MATIEESAKIGCPVDVTERDLDTYFFRRALGQYEAPDTGIEWNPSDDVLLDGEFEFAATDDGGTRLTVKVSYDADELRKDGGDEASLRRIIRAHLAHIQGYCGVRQHEAA